MSRLQIGDACQVQPDALLAAHDAALRTRVAGEIAEAIEDDGAPFVGDTALYAYETAIGRAAFIARAAAEGA